MKRLARWLFFNQRYAWLLLAAWNLLAAVGTEDGPLMRLFFVTFGAFYTVVTVKVWRIRPTVVADHSITASRDGDTWLVECSCGYQGIATGDPNDAEAVARSMSEHAMERQ